MYGQIECPFLKKAAESASESPPSTVLPWVASSMSMFRCTHYSRHHAHGWERRCPQAAGGQELVEAVQPPLAPWQVCNRETPHQPVLCRLLPELMLTGFDVQQIKIQHSGFLLKVSLVKWFTGIRHTDAAWHTAPACTRSNRADSMASQAATGKAACACRKAWRRLVLVRMPINLPFSTTGSAPILYASMRLTASATSRSAPMVTGKYVMISPTVRRVSR